MEITFRKAALEDSRALAALIRGIGWFHRFDAEDLETTAVRIETHLGLCLGDDSHDVWLAEDEQGHLLGYVAVHWLPYLILRAPEGYISELFVEEAARGQGVGQRLLAVVREEGLRRGCSRLSLINFRQRESYERGFYRKAGWSERETGANFILSLMD